LPHRGAIPASDVSQRTAIGSQEQEPMAQKIELVVPNQEAHEPQHDQVHSSRQEIVM
jgi:hypothetical protein